MEIEESLTKEDFKLWCTKALQALFSMKCLKVFTI